MTEPPFEKSSSEIAFRRQWIGPSRPLLAAENYDLLLPRGLREEIHCAGHVFSQTDSATRVSVCEGSN
jgi:hypothetical protein